MDRLPRFQRFLISEKLQKETLFAVDLIKYVYHGYNLEFMPMVNICRFGPSPDSPFNKNLRDVVTRLIYKLEPFAVFLCRKIFSFPQVNENHLYNHGQNMALQMTLQGYSEMSILQYCTMMGLISAQLYARQVLQAPHYAIFLVCEALERFKASNEFPVDGWKDLDRFCADYERTELQKETRTQTKKSEKNPKSDKGKLVASTGSCGDSKSAYVSKSTSAQEDEIRTEPHEIIAQSNKSEKNLESDKDNSVGSKSNSENSKSVDISKDTSTEEGKSTTEAHETSTQSSKSVIDPENKKDDSNACKKNSEDSKSSDVSKSTSDQKNQSVAVSDFASESNRTSKSKDAVVKYSRSTQTKKSDDVPTKTEVERCGEDSSSSSTKEKSRKHKRFPVFSDICASAKPAIPTDDVMKSAKSNTTIKTVGVDDKLENPSSADKNVSEENKPFQTENIQKSRKKSKKTEAVKTLSESKSSSVQTHTDLQ